MIYLWLKSGETEMAKLGYGRTPVDISIQNWALKFAKIHLKERLATQGLVIDVYKVGREAAELVDTDPRWIEKAIRKVMGRHYEPRT